MRPRYNLVSERLSGLLAARTEVFRVKTRAVFGLVLVSLCGSVTGCMSPQPLAQTTAEVPAPQAVSLALNMDYEGADALLATLAQHTVTDADIDRLLSIRGVEAMVDNTTKYVPSHTRELFRAAVKEFVTTRRSTIAPAFRLGESYERRGEILALIRELRSNPDLEAEITRPLAGFVPPLGNLTATVYSVVGGASDGFVPDNERQPAFYMALNRAEGDVDGVKLNMTHELYHVVQRTARERVPGLNERVFNPSSAPAAVRLLTVILEEGTATYVAEAMLARGSGPYIRMWREAYGKNAPAERITANFAEFDRVIAGLRSGATTWDEASKIMFTGTGSPLYFVGYEMSKAIDAYYGRQRIASLLQRHPAAFFRTYVELYRKCPACVRARFSAAAEAYIETLPES
jgi:hypothetical protein